MKKEKWMKWQPIKGIPQTLYLNNLKYDCNILAIDLYNPAEESRILDICFDGFLAFRIMDESKYSWKYREFDRVLLDMQLETNSYQKWSLFIVNSSTYINWFLEQSSGIHDDDVLIHYIIATPDDVIEILDIRGTESPVVQWKQS